MIQQNRYPCLAAITVLLAVLLGGGSAAADGENQKLTVAVVKLQFAEMLAPDVSKLREVINQKVEAAGTQLKSRAALDYALKNSKELFTDECQADDRCWAQAGHAIPAEMILSGTLARTKDGYEGTLVLFAADLGRVARREQVPCPRCSVATFTDRIGDTVFEMVKSNSQERGKVAVRSQPVGAELRVDGRLAGKAPLEITEVVGSHEIVATAEGRREERITVEFKSQGRLEIDLLLKPAAVPAAALPPPKPDSWPPRKLKIVGWSLVGVSLAGIVIGAALLGIDGNKIGHSTTSQGVLVDEKYATAGAGGAIFAISAAIGIVSAVPFYFAKKKQSSAQLKASIGPGSAALTFETAW